LLYVQIQRNRKRRRRRRQRRRGSRGKEINLPCKTGAMHHKPQV